MAGGGSSEIDRHWKCRVLVGRFSGGPAGILSSARGLGCEGEGGGGGGGGRARVDRRGCAWRRLAS